MTKLRNNVRIRLAKQMRLQYLAKTCIILFTSPVRSTLSFKYSLLSSFSFSFYSLGCHRKLSSRHGVEFVRVFFRLVK